MLRINDVIITHVTIHADYQLPHVPHQCKTKFVCLKGLTPIAQRLSVSPRNSCQSCWRGAFLITRLCKDGLLVPVLMSSIMGSLSCQVCIELHINFFIPPY